MNIFFWQQGFIFKTHGIRSGDLVNFSVSILSIILAIGVFKLKNWARLVWMGGSIVLLLWGWICALANLNPLDVQELGMVIYYYPNFICLPILVFFTRPKVKEQFK
ncbi:MAG: hypothetical protein HQL12_08690 [Candidatus Omnitrophica bacterium]|nr:hypothetical protein [Candidatus Omnitrophota bacterium]